MDLSTLPTDSPCLISIILFGMFFIFRCFFQQWNICINLFYSIIIFIIIRIILKITYSSKLSEIKATIKARRTRVLNACSGGSNIEHIIEKAINGITT